MAPWRTSLLSVWRIVVSILVRAWPFRRKPKPFPVMKPYVNLRTWSRRLTLILFPIGLGFFCLIYGFFFALTAPYLLVPFTVPIVALVLLSVWALPDQAHAPTRSVELMFGGLLICLVLWPNYLALSLPGLPWITALRLTGFPMAFLFLICLSTARPFREELRETIGAVRWLGPAMLTFVVMQFVTIVFAKSIPLAVQKSLLQQVYWTGVFVIAAWICRTPGRAERYVALFVVLALPIMAMTIWEARIQKVLWSGHVPPFLKIEDPGVILALSATTRTASGVYRAKATFSTALGLAEFLAMITPFLIHYMMSKYPLIIRVGSALLLPVLFQCIVMTDSRLGIVGYLVSVTLYVLFWGLMRLSRNRTDLFAAAVVYAYPAMFTVAVFGVMFVGKLNRMVFGSGAQAASNAARQSQLEMGIPKVLANPIGHGPSQAGMAMGYGADSFITIDNYYLTLALDYGLIGITAFLALFLVPIGWSVRALLTSQVARDREMTLMIPLAISISAFLVIKLVFSQQDNHTLAFAMVGMMAGLLYRANLMAQPAAQAAEPSRPSRLPLKRAVPGFASNAAGPSAGTRR